jgi:hypothetical protein
MLLDSILAILVSPHALCGAARILVPLIAVKKVFVPNRSGEKDEVWQHNVIGLETTPRGQP